MADIPRCLQCRGAGFQPVLLTLQVVFLLKLPSRMVWGPGPFLHPPPLFYLCFCLHIGVGSSGGQGSSPQAQAVPGEFWLEPICRVGLRLSCHPTKDHTVKLTTALSPCCFIY